MVMVQTCHQRLTLRIGQISDGITDRRPWKKRELFPTTSKKIELRRLAKLLRYLVALPILSRFLAPMKRVRRMRRIREMPINAGVCTKSDYEHSKAFLRNSVISSIQDAKHDIVVEAIVTASCFVVL